MEFFKNRKPNYEKLLEYGFTKNKNDYVFIKQIVDGEFELKVIIDKNDEIKTSVTETSTNEPYTLHLVEGVNGAFVGIVKEIYKNTLLDIAQKCFEMDVFKYEYSKKVIEYAYEKYGDKVEYLWEKFPENAVCRRKDNKKWYFAILTCARCKLGGKIGGNLEKGVNFTSHEENIEVINLQIKPDEMAEITKDENIYPAYHMNKKRWISIVLDGSVDIEKIYRFIDNSYILAGKKTK